MTGDNDDALDIAEKQIAPDEASQAPEPTPEERAREMGWRPIEEFSGPREKFVDAEEFLERGETLAPLVAAQNRKLKADLEKREREFAERLERMEKMAQRNAERERAEYEAKIKRLEAAERRAVDEADTDSYDAIKAERAALEKQAPTQEVSPQPAAPDRLQTWMVENPWFQLDENAKRVAMVASQRAAAKGADLEAELQAAEAAVRRSHPHYFDDEPVAPAEQVRGGPQPDGGSAAARRLGGAARTQTATNLPQEARRQMAKDLQRFGISEAQWLREYYSE